MITRRAILAAAVVLALGCGVALGGPVQTRPASGPSTRATGYAAYLAKTQPLVDSLGGLRRLLEEHATDAKSAKAYVAKAKEVEQAHADWRKELSEDELTYPSVKAVDEAWNNYHAAAFAWFAALKAEKESRQLEQDGDAQGAADAAGRNVAMIKAMGDAREKAEKSYVEARRLLKTREGSKSFAPD